MSARTSRSIRGRRVAAIWLSLASYSLPTLAQVSEATPREIIRDLGSHPLTSLVSGCGEVNEVRDAAVRLALGGATAMPDIELALDSLDHLGQKAPIYHNGGWLLLAYAKIREKEALPRLRTMIESPTLVTMTYDIDRAISLALNMTSYVSATRKPLRVFHCARLEEPRDALNQFIIAWMINDERLLSTILGPTGKAALATLLRDDESWLKMRMKSPQPSSKGIPSVGFRFLASDVWALPEETLNSSVSEATHPRSGAFVLDTSFYDRNGSQCGGQRISFVTTGNQHQLGRVSYLLDEPNLGALLRTLAHCALR